MNPLRFRPFLLACLAAAVLTLTGCANFPANTPSAVETAPSAAKAPKS